MTAILWSDVVAVSSPLSATVLSLQTDILELVNVGFAGLPEVFDGEDGIKTRMARIYIACHFASLPGAGEQRAGGPVVSESRGGLSRSYANLSSMAHGNNTWSDTQWGRRYLQLRNGSKARWPRVAGGV